jgi:S-DNA-T family DNA segregation ATPase FtsK/SpoIIIE
MSETAVSGRFAHRVFRLGRVGAHWVGMEPIPTCDVVGPDGSPLVIRPHATTDSVADLARALDLSPTTPLWIDDRCVAPNERLVGAGLRVGSTVSTVPPDVAVASVDERAVEVAVVVGPGCSPWIGLGPGRHTIGRATTAAIRVDDPSVELHHGVLEVAPDATVTFTQLTGAFPVTLAGSVLSIGASRLVVRGAADAGVGDGTSASIPTGIATGSIVPAERDPWRRVVQRGPEAPIEPPPHPIDVPQPPTTHRPPPLTSLVGAGIAALGAGVLAMVLGQLLFAVFAAVGAIASLATWAVGAIVARRDRRRAVATYRRAVAAFEDALDRARCAASRDHHRRHRSVVDALDRLRSEAPDPWSRRLVGDGTLWATVGRGTAPWLPPIAIDERAQLGADLLVAVERCDHLDDVAIPLALGASTTIGLRGSTTLVEALCRSIIVQLATDYGPADWELQVVTTDPARWGWVRWLPHARHRTSVVAASDPMRLAEAMERDSSGDARCRRTLIVVDAPAELRARTSALRRRLDRGDVSCLALVGADAAVPAIVQRILDVGDTGTARWVETSAAAWTAADRDIVVAGITAATAEAAARRLAPLLDPEDGDGIGAVPTHVALTELEPVGDGAATAIARRWSQSGCDPAPVASIGMSADGVVDIDLVRDGPHGLIAGTTGSGKSELLRTLVVSLAARASPDHVSMILVDYKGGSTFDACARLPHTVGVVTDLDDGLAARVLLSLDAEIRRRERVLRSAGSDDLAAYRRSTAEPLPRLVVVIDEFASLAKELPDFLGALVSIAQRGRSLGIHLLLATQRPAGVVTDDIRANTNLRIALRLQDRTDAHDVVGDPTPAGFPGGAPGRGALRLGPDELIVFQTADSSSPVRAPATRLTVERLPGGPGRSPSDGSPAVAIGDGATALDQLVDAIGQAATMLGVAAPHRPWIDPLPAVVRARDLGDDTAIGLLDDPAGQCRRPLRWQPGDGSLLLVGPVGSGTTTAAATIAARCIAGADPGALHVYVVDAQGGAVWNDLASSPCCGAVVRVAETERVGRLLDRLATEIDRRSTCATRSPTIVVVVDGLAAVRDALGEVGHGEGARRLDRVLRDGLAVGVVAVVTTDGASASALAVPRSQTWTFSVAGRLRVDVSGLDGQVVHDPELFAGLGSGDDACVGHAAPVLVLPELVDPTEFDAAVDRVGVATASVDGGPLALPIGLGADDLEPAALCVPVGDHVFIGGAARTGRSTALRQIEWAWRTTHPDGVVRHVDRRHPLGDGECEAFAPGQPVLVVVDDADRVDDQGGDVARLLARPGVTVAAAARLDAVRAAYGHWTREVARSRCGLILTSLGDVDGELLGVTLPRRSLIPPRPGLAWIIDHHGHRLVQVAARMQP